MPFILTRLPAQDRQAISAAIYLGMSAQANFEFHLTNWLSSEAKPSPYKTLPELDQLRGLPSLCLKGDKDSSSICEQTGAKGVTTTILPGDHHYDEDYQTVAKTILDFVFLKANNRGKPVKN